MGKVGWPCPPKGPASPQGPRLSLPRASRSYARPGLKRARMSCFCLQGRGVGSRHLECICERLFILGAVGFGREISRL